MCSIPPPFHVLAEPTSGLDPVARLDILDVFREFMVEESHTILFSTHITSDLERIADHLRIIGRGRIIFAGTLDELTETYVIARGVTAELSPDARTALIGPRSTASGGFEALIHATDTALFDSRTVIETPSLDEAVAGLTRSQAAPASSTWESTTSPVPSTKDH